MPEPIQMAQVDSGAQKMQAGNSLIINEETPHGVLKALTCWNIRVSGDSWSLLSYKKYRTTIWLFIYLRKV